MSGEETVKLLNDVYHQFVVKHKLKIFENRHRSNDTICISSIRSEAQT